MPSRLTPLQEHVLERLAGIEPRWTSTGGAALAGFYLGHRTTRDLDLFWHGRAELGPLSSEVERTLQAAGWDVERLQTGPALERLLVRAGEESVVLDLVAEPVAFVEPPEPARTGSATILVDTPHEILVNKLCSLVQRAEVRDLQDVHALLERGGDLDRALADAPRKDAGFSPLLLAWLLKELPVERLEAASGRSPGESERLARFRDELVDRLVRIAGR